MRFRSFLIKLMIVTIVVALMISLINYFVQFFNSFQLFTWLALAYFFLLTVVTGYIGFRSFEKSPHAFVASVNGIVLIKLFLSVAFIIAYVLFSKPEGPGFIISFFILYIVYTVFEIRELVVAQKKGVLKNQ